jgi:hypothetical protein
MANPMQVQNAAASAAPAITLVMENMETKEG